MFQFTEYYSDRTSISSTGDFVRAVRRFEESAGMDIACSIIRLDDKGNATDIINSHEDSTMDNSWWTDSLL